MSLVAEAARVLAESGLILAFTGAGISTESGIPDFRGPNGLWTKVDPEDFNIERYTSDPDLRARSWQMHLEGALWGARSAVEPNRGHLALKRLADAGRLAGVATQNVDGLHHKSGLATTQVAELHGNVRSSHCVQCAAEWETEEVLGWIEAGNTDPSCPRCGGMVKTNTIMFGELLPGEELDKANGFLQEAGSLLVVGSTVAVWPASDVVLQAALRSMPIVIVNQGETEADHLAAVKLDDAIGDVLPGMVDLILGAKPGP
jgi:NAD-dependent protein deacetylase/lipoamidase